MAETPTVTWGGHTFYVYEFSAKGWRDVPGVYIFAGVVDRWWQAHYIGQTESFAMRLQGTHEREAEAKDLGATHVHACVVQNASERIAMESALISAYHPSLNRH